MSKIEVYTLLAAIDEIASDEGDPNALKKVQRLVKRSIKKIDGEKDPD